MARAIQAYKLFYPTVSAACAWDGAERAGAVPNRKLLILRGGPRQALLGGTSDAPSAVALLDLDAGPLVLELPKGELMGAVSDLHQRCVLALGLAAPYEDDERVLVLPPEHAGPLPDGCRAGTSTTRRALLLLRAVPTPDENRSALELLKAVRLRPLEAPEGAAELEVLDLGERPADLTPFAIEKAFGFWERLHEVVDAERPCASERTAYGELAALGIAGDRPFAPGAEERRLFEQAALIANAQLRVRCFGGRIPESMAWPDRRWEQSWPFDGAGCAFGPGHEDLEARERWFFRTALVPREVGGSIDGAASLAWLAMRDADGAMLDGSRTYKLTLPLPVPAGAGWSVTAYDTQTRSELLTEEGRAALRSAVELADAQGSSVELFFGPAAPPGQEGRWIRTGQGWFACLRLWWAEADAWSGAWKPGDLEPLP